MEQIQSATTILISSLSVQVAAASVPLALPQASVHPPPFASSLFPPSLPIQLEALEERKISLVLWLISIHLLVFEAFA